MQYEFKKCVVINMFIMTYAIFFEIIILSHTESNPNKNNDDLGGFQIQFQKLYFIQVF